MTSSTFTLRLSPSLLSEAAKLAEQEGVSLNEWIVTAITEKIEAANIAKSSAKARR
jgi:predicted HicB family RNase H-like nuclease